MGELSKYVGRAVDRDPSLERNAIAACGQRVRARLAASPKIFVAIGTEPTPRWRYLPLRRVDSSVENRHFIVKSASISPGTAKSAGGSHDPE